MSTNDLRAWGTNPGTEYAPTNAFPPTGTPYNEERQVTLPGIGTQIYRTVNAYFNNNTKSWTAVSSGPAYAEVQNPDGSIHFYTLNTTTGNWEGSGNNAVFNAVDYGMSTATGFDNTNALTLAINAAFSSGGIVYIPPGTYEFSGTVSLSIGDLPPGTDPGIIIMGAGGSTLLEQTQPQDLFSFSTLTSGNGVRLRDLHISYTATVTGSTVAAAVRVSDCQSVTCERVLFANCPRALHLDNQADQCGLFDCRISYGYGMTVSTDQIMVYISGTEDFIDHCIIEQPSQAPSTEPIPGPTGCTGIFVTAAASVLSVTNTHISDFTTGINIQGLANENPVNAFFSNVVCECWTNAVIIKPFNSTDQVYQVFFNDCIFARESHSTDTTSVGVLIDTNGGVSTNVSEIFFSNCLCYLWDAAGVQINAGQNIVITGGRIGSNGFSAETGGGGISITGTTPGVVPANVSVIGVDLTSKLPSPAFQKQPYALSITAAVAGLFVRGCNVSGYTSATETIYTNGAGTTIEITDCAGYNDQGTILQSSVPPPAGQLTNQSSWTNALSGWFGPVTFYIVGGTNNIVSIGNATTREGTGFTSGTFRLAPGQQAGIAGNHSSITSFLAMGE
jgi:hypothetical protein